MHHRVSNRDDPVQIKAQLDLDRDALSVALGSLRAQFTTDKIWSVGGSLITSNAGPYTRAVDAAVRANPLALAVTAVGLAWLTLGRHGQTEGASVTFAEPMVDAEARWEDEGGTTNQLREPDALWMAQVDRLHLRASEIMARIAAAMRDNLAPAADLEQSRADVAAALGKDVRRVMTRGLDDLTKVEREAALAARERAYLARFAAKQAGFGAVLDHPIAAGVVLATAGAAVAALLSQSSMERQVLGAPRDLVVTEAKQVLRAERQRFSRTLRKIADVWTRDISAARAG